jgi:hypothetical protein
MNQEQLYYCNIYRYIYGTPEDSGYFTFSYVGFWCLKSERWNCWWQERGHPNVMWNLGTNLISLDETSRLPVWPLCLPHWRDGLQPPRTFQIHQPGHVTPCSGTALYRSTWHGGIYTERSQKWSFLQSLYSPNVTVWCFLFWNSRVRF